MPRRSLRPQALCQGWPLDRHRRQAQLYLVEKGSGNPTVLFEAGIAATNLNWFHIQEPFRALLRQSPMIAADWAGAAQLARRGTPANIAAELHQLLAGAAIKPPYILVDFFGGW